MGPYIALIILILAIFAICYGVDKLFTKLFRGKAQHQTGKAVRLNKRFGSFGLIVAILGLAGVFTGIGSTWLLTIGGVVLVIVGIGMIVYYMTFGVYYDADSFIFSTFGHKSVTYAFRDIQGQMLYTSAGGVLIELHLADGRALQLQPGMKGVGEFMDHAFAAWRRQTGRQLEDCDFYNPDQSCWFPPAK